MNTPYLQRFLDQNFKGSSVMAANAMVADFCIKHHIPGSAYGYDLYKTVQEAWKKALKAEKQKQAILNEGLDKGGI